MPGITETADETVRWSEIRFLAQQFGMNLLVAVVMTFVVTALLFGGRDTVPLWGMGNLAFDLIPSTLLPTFGATMAVTKVTASAVRRGVIRPGGHALYGWLPRTDALAGLAFGLGLLAVLGTGFVGITSLVFGQQPVPFSVLLIWKLIYALILCLVNTPMIVGRAKQLSRPVVSKG
jgi:hypothetical protein